LTLPSGPILTSTQRLVEPAEIVLRDAADRLDRARVLVVERADDLVDLAELTASELRTRGYYLGSNVSYNVKKLVEAGYLHHARAEIVLRDAADRLDRARVLVVERADDLVDLAALLGQADPTTN
jgi:hypothetical protein